ncbi:hypothetical protein LMG8286_00791 [Campylobacter suis]|uniref:Uncharacterized protein n=1 Tax=Campylobacter suis TaxID=2790657 RepID=A0ABN7K4Z1_9BACT|nr:hypothetical protein LMG8286_00791 [Campylobacter suis]
MRTYVANGSSELKLSNTALNFGTTRVMTNINAAISEIMMMAGYRIAFLKFFSFCSIPSKISASLARLSLIFPVFSPSFISAKVMSPTYSLKALKAAKRLSP